MICITPMQNQISLSAVYKDKKKNYRKRDFKEKGNGELKKKLKIFLTALAMANKKDPTR